MNLLSEIARNASRREQDRIQPRFYALSTLIGLLGVLSSVAPAYVVMRLLSRVLDVDMQAPSNTQANGTLWTIAFCCSMPIIIYLSCVLVAGLFGVLMVRLGHFSPNEAMHYAFRGRCPDHWFREAYRPDDHRNSEKSADEGRSDLTIP